LPDVRGKFILVGIPGNHGPSTLNLSIMTLIGNGALCGVSHIGSRKQILDMLQLAADKEIKPWLEEIPITAEGHRHGMQRMVNSEVRYKICLTEFDKEFQ
jgi:alcohol dehydrogenase (NADP+)